MPTQHRQHDDGQSSIYEKLSPDLRRALDVAIIERIPPTFAAIWMEHKLADHGISFSAFYRYARRLRDRANFAEIAELTPAKDSDLSAALCRLLTCRILDGLLHHDELPARELTSLIAALRQASRSIREDRKADEDSRLAWARLEQSQAQLRHESDDLHSFRDRLLGALSAKPAPLPKSMDPSETADCPELQSDPRASSQCSSSAASAAPG